MFWYTFLVKHSFFAKIFIINVNPYVLLPKKILNALLKEFGKNKGPIPVKGTINGKPFTQTLVRFQGAYRLYVNGIMIRATKVKVGDRAMFEIQIDKVPREVSQHPDFAKALAQNRKVQEAFSKFPQSRQKEINKYLNNIKSDAIRAKNIDKVVRYLKGEKVDYFVLLRNKE